MGFLLKFSRPAIQVHDLSLWLLTPTTMVHYIDFLIARRCTGKQHVCKLRSKLLLVIININKSECQQLVCKFKTTILYLTSCYVVAAAHLDKVINALKRVLQWRMGSYGEDVSRWITWLDNLQQEVSSEMLPAWDL